MKWNDVTLKIRQIASPLLFEKVEKRKAATITLLVLILLAASLLLIISPLFRHLYMTLAGILAGDIFLLISVILAWRGRDTFASYAIPVFLFMVATFVAFQGHGIHDITLLSFPMIIALSGLMLGKNGVLLTASIGSACLGIVYLGEINGFIPGAIQFTGLTTFDDILIMALLLWITAAFIYFASNNLTRSLESTKNSEQALRQANTNLEQYAAILKQRTEQLLTGARVSRAATSILDPDELCQQVVDMVCKRFGLYYVGLFLLDKTHKWAILHAGTGEAGRQMLKNGHKLKVGDTSMIGWCIANKSARIARDVGTEAVRFDNPLLPDTRSELALPLISRDEVIGALSIQSNEESAFTEEDIVSFQTMSAQLAIAIRNARLYDQLQKELANRLRAEKEIRKLNEELEQRVAMRTSELQAANERLTTLSRLKDEFLANVSHELRTPITSIMLYHSMIEAKPQQAQQYLSPLRRETSRLANLIEDLLYLSRLEQGRTPFHPAGLDLNLLVQDYVSARAPLAAQRQLTLTLEPDDSLPLIEADEQMLGQVVSALLTNALNYTPSKGEIKVRIQAETRQLQAWAGFSVQDNGPGLTPEDQKHVFERFFRGKAGRESSAPGTGLGLSIAREIVERHKGRIEVRSDGAGKGATFVVWLPVGQSGR